MVDWSFSTKSALRPGCYFPPSVYHLPCQNDKTCILSTLSGYQLQPVFPCLAREWINIIRFKGVREITLIFQCLQFDCRLYYQIGSNGSGSVRYSMETLLTGSFNTTEPRHGKTNKVTVRTAKTQISLCIRPVRSESSAWRNLGSLATHWAHSEDSGQTGRMPRLIWVFAGRTLILLVLSCRGSEKQGRTYSPLLTWTM